MKKILCAVLALFMLVTLTSCGSKPSEPEKTSGEFEPLLDTDTDCSITVAGSYDNFEALEMEFDRFNETYPNVELNYVKLDDYNNVLATALDGNDKPNIFFSYTWMIGNEQYAPVVAHMENLSDPALGLDLNCIRPGLVNHDKEDRILLIPVFSRTYGMLVNNDLFKKEGLSVPTTWTELMDVCEAFRGKGYASPMMGYSLKSSGSFMYTVAYPQFTATLSENPEALALANKLDPAAGEYMRPALEMMICAADTVSGTKKRGSQSEAFTNSPFNYTFSPIPMTEKGGYFIDSPSIEFSVNKNCNDLEMTNEFMRFLITDEELNEMASVKRLVSPTTVLSLDSVYAPFGQVPSDLILSPEVLGIADALTVQIRVASFQVGRGEITVDEAIKRYGSFE